MTCYRHPDREAFVRCQRCERFICPACQVEASVGFLCPDDAGGTPKQVSRQRSRALGLGRPQVTLTLIAINIAAWLVEISPVGQLFQAYFQLLPVNVPIAPWQLITGGFLHDPSSPLHILFNMYSLYIFGQVLEPMLGRARFVALYLISLFAGSLAVIWFGASMIPTVGASGAIFGLMGAYFVVLRSLGQQSNQLLGLIAINLVFTFININTISWQAHIGGLVGGAAVAFIYSKTRNASQNGMQKLAIVSLVAVLLLLAVLRIPQLNLF
jgi:membrane associated rhomboid family serine protease